LITEGATNCSELSHLKSRSRSWDHVVCNSHMRNSETKLNLVIHIWYRRSLWDIQINYR